MPQRGERDRVHKNRYDESGIDTSSNSGARGWTSFKRNIIYAIRSLKINGVEINRSVCIHAQTARRCRTRRVHSSIHTTAPTRRVPFVSTENTSRCGLSVPDEPDAVDAVCTRATRRVPFANGTRVGLNLQCEHGLSLLMLFSVVYSVFVITLQLYLIMYQSMTTIAWLLLFIILFSSSIVMYLHHYLHQVYSEGKFITPVIKFN